jgi:hypothetical protein
MLQLESVTVSSLSYSAGAKRAEECRLQDFVAYSCKQPKFRLGNIECLSDAGSRRKKIV